MQRQGVGHPANVPGNHRHRTEFTHGPRGTQHHAVDQAPFNVGNGDVPEHLPAIGPEQARSLFFLGALFLHQRDQFTRHERHGDENRRQHDARQGEDDLDVVILQPRAEQALSTEHQYIDQTGDHRRHRERQVDQRHQHALAAERIFTHAPCRADTEHQVQRHRDQHRNHGEFQRRQGVRLEDRGEECTQAQFQALGHHDEQWQQQKQCKDQPAEADQESPRRGTATAGGIREGCCNRRLGHVLRLLMGFRCAAAAS